MKKMLLLCAGLLLAAGITSAEVVSTNIVGYVKSPATGTYTPTGPTFVQVLTFTNLTGEAKWRLGDIKVEGMNSSYDFIQILDPNTAKTVVFATYSEDGWGNPEWVGWWEYPTSSDIPLDDEYYNFGTGFLTYLTSPNVIFTYAGEVMADPVTVDCSGMTYPLVANILPQDISLGDINAEGMNTSFDFIQILDPTTAQTLVFATYSADGWGNPEWVGWWEYPTSSDISLDNEPLKAGQAFLGYFSTGGVKINFPSPLALTP